MKSPCLECEDRHVGCHSECRKYMGYRLLLSCMRNTIRKETVGEAYAMARSRRFKDTKLIYDQKSRRK